MGLNNRWMAAFLKEMTDAFPELRQEITPQVGRYGPTRLALVPVLNHLQQLVADGDIVPLTRMVALLDRYYSPHDERLMPFNSLIGSSSSTL